MIISGATTPGQSGPGSDDNEEVLHIPRSSSITGASSSECLVSYSGHSFFWGGYPSAEVQLVYFAAPADWLILINWWDPNEHYDSDLEGYSTLQFSTIPRTLFQGGYYLYAGNSMPHQLGEWGEEKGSCVSFRHYPKAKEIPVTLRMYVCMYPTPLHRQNVTGSFLSGIL